MRIFFALIFCLVSINTQASSIMKLAGTVTNNLGIRDDILRYIETSIPSLTENSRYAVVKLASNQQALYYKVKSYAEASKLIISNSIALRCLSMDRSDDYDIFRKIESLMANTEERRSHILNTCAILFSHEGIPHQRVSRDELADRCRSKDY